MNERHTSTVRAHGARTTLILLAIGPLLPALSPSAGHCLPSDASPAAVASELTRDEKERFCREAEILEQRKIGSGVTESIRATLSDGTLTHDVQIQTVDIFMKQFNAGVHSELNFRDFWGFNVAAYRLDKLLDLGMVPVSVERTIDGRRASVTWWIDGAMMTAREFHEGRHQHPDPAWLNAQKLQGWAFQQLVLNRDPNLGNFVIDGDWKPWMIDFTRAFRQWKKFDDVKPLTRVPRRFYERLVALDPAAVERELGPYLKKVEMKGLLARHKKLIEHYDTLIRRRGEAVVLID